MAVKELLMLVLMMTFWQGQGEVKVRRSARNRDRGSRGMQEFDGRDMSGYTPAPLTPGEVQCQVGVQETRYHDGRCIRLGNSERPACQAGILLDIDNAECARGGRRRQGGRGRGRGRGRNNGGGRRNNGQRG